MDKERFLKLLPAIKKAARNLGYAVAVHGSLKRDFDIIAVPWVIGASDPDNLALAIYDAAGGKRWRVWWDMGRPKPYGRKCYAFDWGETNDNRDYCDLSVVKM